MPPIDVLVVGDANLHAQVAVALAEVGAFVKVRGCARAERLATIARLQDIGVVVAGLRDAVGESTTSALLALKRRNESIPFIISAHLTPSGVRDVVRAIDAGLEAGGVIRDVEGLAAAIMHVVVERVHVGPAAVLLLTGWPLLPPGARGFFSTAAIGAAGPITTSEAARALGMAVRTLEGRLVQSGLPPPHRILGFCRILHASWYMDRLCSTPKNVTRKMRFSSVPALYNFFRHYAAPPPGALVVQGGYEEMLLQGVHGIRPPPATNPFGPGGREGDRCERYTDGDREWPDAERHPVPGAYAKRGRARVSEYDAIKRNDTVRMPQG